MVLCRHAHPTAAQLSCGYDEQRSARQLLTHTYRLVSPQLTTGNAAHNYVGRQIVPETTRRLAVLLAFGCTMTPSKLSVRFRQGTLRNR